MEAIVSHLSTVVKTQIKMCRLRLKSEPFAADKRTPRDSVPTGSFSLQEERVAQLHRWITDDQGNVLLNGYYQGLLKRAKLQAMMGVGKTRFLALVKAYRNNRDAFSVGYERRTPDRLPATVDVEIEGELIREKATADNRRLLISGYNYTALRDPP